MLSARELAQARADYQTAFLTQAATILAPVTTWAAGGGSDETLQSIGPIPCRVVTPRIRAHESEVAGGPRSQARMYVELPVGTVIDPTYKIAVEGVTFEVVGDDGARGEALRLTVEVVKAV